MFESEIQIQVLFSHDNFDTLVIERAVPRGIRQVPVQIKVLDDVPVLEQKECPRRFVGEVNRCIDIHAGVLIRKGKPSYQPVELFVKYTFVRTERVR